MEILKKSGHINVTSYGRGIPPTISVKGYEVCILEETT